MAPSSETRNWDALASLTLENFFKGGVVEDNISITNAFFHKIFKSGAYKGNSSLGERAAVDLMYELGTADVYSSYDMLDVTPMDGVTKAFFEWTQASVPITISRKERRQNSGDQQIASLLETKTTQALLGIQELFGKMLLQGNGPNSATAITTPYTSPVNGATGILPLPLLVSNTAAISASIGNITPATYTWWSNQSAQSSSTTYAGFLKELRSLRNKCSVGQGGFPDLHITDRLTYEYYEACLAGMHQNPSYMKADIPFENIAFYGSPVTWDELVPDIANGTIASIPVNTSGTWWMLNTKYFSIQYDKETNFITTPMQTPENQDASTCHILWMGCSTVSNRRKQGVLASITNTYTS